MGDGRVYSEAEILAALRSVADTLGHSPSQREFREADTPMSCSTVIEYYESWNAAKEAAGLDIYTSKPTRITQEDCHSALRKAAEELGHSPTQPEYRTLDTDVSIKTIMDTCGSWNDAKEQAGLSTSNQGTTVENRREKCIEAIQQAAAELGHYPTMEEFRQSETAVSTYLISDEFDSWDDAIETARSRPTGP